MPTRQEQIAAAYKKIKEITGLKFNEKDVKQVEKAIGQIYINGHNYCISNRVRPLGTVEDGMIFEVAKALEKAQNPANNSFVSIMKPDDPYAVPRMVPYRNPEASIFSSSSKKWILNDAAKAYEKNFKETHRENIRKLREDLRSTAKNEKYLYDAALYFDRDLLQEDGSFKDRGNYIEEFTTRTENSIDMCNALLLGRGYTLDDLRSNDPEVQEAKKAVGQEITDLIYGSGSHQEKGEKLQNLMDEMIEGFRRQKMKSVDYSDDSTFDNARYNHKLAVLVASVEQMIHKARDGKYIDNPRLDEQEKRLVRIKNFTDGIAMLDSNRIAEVENGSRMPEIMINQLLMDRMGTSYNLYRTTEWNKVENDVNIGHTIQNDIDEDAGDLGEPSDAYQEAYDVFVKTGNPEPFKALLNQYVDKNETVIQKVEANVRLAANEKKVLPDPENKDYWYEGIPGMTTSDYLQGLGKALKANSSSQTGRASTMQNLFLAYGLYEAEQNGQNYSIQDFFTNTELQKETGRKAYEFFTAHPIPGATPEETEANVKVFGQVIAALDRKLLDTEIPRCNFEDRAEAVSGRKYLNNLKSLMTDSHQLNGLVPRDMWHVFEAEQGGKEKYEEIKNQISIAEDLVQAEHSLYDIPRMRKWAVKDLFRHVDEVHKGIQGVYLLNTIGKECPGKKIGELPKDSVTAQEFAIIEEHSQAAIQISLMDKTNTLRGKKDVLEYITSFGEKDPASVVENMKSAMEMGRELIQAEEQAKSAEPKVEEAKAEQPKPAEPQAEEAKAEQPKSAEPKVEEAKAEQPKSVEPQAEEAKAEQPESAEPEVEQHDWSAEYTPEEWKQRLEKFYDDVDSHDPALLRSSAEYKAVKAGLKEAAKAVNDKDKFNRLMDNVFQNAGDYIQKKLNTKIGEHYGKERLDVITNVRDLLAAGKDKPLSSEKIGELFGTGDTPAQKMESAVINIGKYLWDVQADAKNKNYEQAYKAQTLLERVLIEGGKNRKTLEQLRANMNFTKEYPDRVKMMERVRDGITHAAIKRVGMNARMAGWYHVMDAYKQVVKNDPDPKIQELAEKNAVRNVDMIGSLAQTAMSAKMRAVDVNTDHNMTKNELGAIAALNTFEHLIKKQDTESREDYISMMHAFLKEQEAAENIAKFFAEGEVGKRLEAQNQKGDPEKYIFGAKATQAMADEGEHKFIVDRLQKSAEKFGREIPDPQQVKQNKAQKGPMNF